MPHFMTLRMSVCLVFHLYNINVLYRSGCFRYNTENGPFVSIFRKFVYRNIFRKTLLKVLLLMLFLMINRNVVIHIGNFVIIRETLYLRNASNPGRLYFTRNMCYPLPLHWQDRAGTNKSKHFPSLSHPRYTAGYSTKPYHV